MQRINFRIAFNLICFLSAAFLSSYLPAQTLSQSWINVTNTNDSGPGSLRAAIGAVNASSPGKIIRFNIAGAGPRVIYLMSPLPAIQRRVHINGYYQPGSRPNTLIEGDDRIVRVGLKAAFLNMATSSFPSRCLPDVILDFTSTAIGSSVRGIAFDNAQTNWGTPNQCTGANSGIRSDTQLSVVGNTFGLYPEGNGGNLEFAVVARHTASSTDRFSEIGAALPAAAACQGQAWCALARRPAGRIVAAFERGLDRV